MSTTVCTSCKGEYLPLQPDGTLYFHTCPDVVKPTDRRNENVPSTKDLDTGKMISAGKGITVKP